MSLYSKAAGILDTHVTWQDVEVHLQNALSTRASFGINKKATNISDFKGFLSIVALVEPDWVTIESERETQLPEKLIVKISSQLAMVSFSKTMKNDTFGEEKLKHLSKMIREFHNREVEVYKVLSENQHENLPFTRVYSSKSFESDEDLKGFIIAEYVSESKSLGMHDNISADELIPVIQGISTFAALGAKLSPEEKMFAMGEVYIESLFRQFFNQSDMENKFKILKKSLEEEDPEKVEKLVGIYRHYLNIVPNYSKMADSLGFKKVLQHGDLWQSNLLFTEEKGKLNLKAIIDWQICAEMSPGLDTSRLFVACLSTKDRRERGNELLRVYYDTFNATFGGELFSFEELVNSYNLYFPTMVMLIQTRLLPILEATNIPEPEKSKTRVDVLEKMVGLMEDVFEVHEYNLETFPDFMKL